MISCVSINQLLYFGVPYGSVVWHHHLTHSQSDKLEALKKCAVCIILYPLTLPYITALGYLKLESLKHHQMEAHKKFFNDISEPDNCLHHLLPPPRDTQLITRMRYANTYPVPLTKTKRFCSFINFGLANYVDWLYFCILCVYYVCIFSILYIVICRPILIYVEWCTFAYSHVRQELSRIFCTFFSRICVGILLYCILF